MKYCTKCGTELADEAKFCTACGQSSEVRTVVTPASSPTPSRTTTPEYSAQTSGGSGGKTTASYFFSIIGAVISFIVRKNVGDIFWSNTSHDYFNGIDKGMKPLYSLIPLAAAILVSLLIVSDRYSDSHRKSVAFVVNIIFIIIALLFIWIDVPVDRPYYYY